MKLTTEKIRQLVAEELSKIINEGVLGSMKQKKIILRNKKLTNVPGPITVVAFPATQQEHAKMTQSADSTDASSRGVHFKDKSEITRILLDDESPRGFYLVREDSDLHNALVNLDKSKQKTVSFYVFLEDKTTFDNLIVTKEKGRLDLEKSNLVYLDINAAPKTAKQRASRDLLHVDKRAQK